MVGWQIALCSLKAGEYMKDTMNLTKRGIVFDAKPDAVPYNYRISYKVSLLCMIIKQCCGRRGCSLIKMHIIANAATDSMHREKLSKYLSSHIQREFLVRFDPAINRALEYSLADGLITQQGNGTYKLTEKGRLLVNNILSDSDIFSYEKTVLQEIATDLTEEKIRAISERWKYLNAEN